ncbi:MAG TPA: HIT domain-containing protein [Spirochaetia bacterium]|nr:HIT domain-containing protein [Spirochaetia bacterium]
MQQIWAPWRTVYISGPEQGECIFCDKVNSAEDEKNYVLYRGKKCFVMLNLYPYNNGHLLVAPNRHAGDMDALSDEEMLEMLLVTRKMVRALRSFNPEGFNIGANLGRTAGAGIPGHFHIHIVPRWNGDTNFMPVLDDVRVISESLDTTYRKLQEALQNSGG